MTLVSQAALHAYHSSLARRNEKGDFEYTLMKQPHLCNSYYWEKILDCAERPSDAQDVIDLVDQVCDTDAIEIGQVARYAQMARGIARKTLFEESVRISKQKMHAKASK
jgi:hypothetical protein